MALRRSLVSHAPSALRLAYADHAAASPRMPCHLAHRRPAPPSGPCLPSGIRTQAICPNPRETHGPQIHTGTVCAAYCTPFPLSLRDLKRDFSSTHQLALSPSVPDPDDANIGAASEVRGRTLAGPAQIYPHAEDVLVLPCQHVAPDGACSPRGTVFFFRSGAMVFWGVPLADRQALFRRASLCELGYEDGLAGSGSGSGGVGVSGNAARMDLHRAQRRFAGKQMAEMESFEHEFAYHVGLGAGGRQAAFRNDQIYLSRSGGTAELLAFSYGLAQSVQLHLSEVALDALVGRTERVPEELARYGRISLTATDIRKLIGELLSARYSVNLVSDILDTPDFFWQRPELERLYTECIAAVEVKQRLKVLNARAEVMNDALHILNSELAAASSMRLERAIVFLIFVEVVLEIVAHV